MSENLQEIKKRTVSIEAAMQLTSAMKMKAAVNLQKLETRLRAAREALSDFSLMTDELMELYASEDNEKPGKARPRDFAGFPLISRAFLREEDGVKSLTKKSKDPVLIVVFGSERGFAGDFPRLVREALIRRMKEVRKDGGSLLLYPLGDKAEKLCEKLGGETIRTGNFPELPKSSDAVKLLESIGSVMREHSIEKTEIVSARYLSASSQEASVFRLFPFAGNFENSGHGGDRKINVSFYKIDPSMEEVLEESLELYLVSLLYVRMLESRASEERSRSLAMTKASDNSEEMIAELKRRYQIIRQEKITNEMIEIAGGAMQSSPKIRKRPGENSCR